jgi:serine-type D-Ala-D-Ala carboxypeptidase (penicillin-binding protein 5/6)
LRMHAVLNSRRLLRRHWLAAAFVLSGAAFGLAAPNPIPGPKKDEGFQTSAPYAILVEADSGSVLFEKSADTLVAPSSMSKLMTAEYVFNEIKQGNLKLEQEFTVSENAWRRGGAPARGSTMYAAIHSRIKVEDLLRGMIIQSGNDACIVLAEGLTGNEMAFGFLLTKRARELGLTKSVFTNSNGLSDPNHRMTVRELAMLAQHIIATYPEFYQIYGEKEFTWNKIRQQNRNPLLAMNIGADGLKTGFTAEGGYGMVGSAVQNGLRLIVVVNGLKSAKERADEAKRLLEWGFRGFESRILFAEGETVGEAKLYGADKGHVPLIAPRVVRLMVPKGVNEKIIARVTYTGPVRAPVVEGQTIGRLKVWRGEIVALEMPLRAADSAGPGSMSQRAFDALTELVIGLFRAGTQRL